MARLIFSNINMDDRLKALKEASIYIGKYLRSIEYFEENQVLEAEGKVDEEDIDKLRTYGYEVVLK